MSAKDKTIERYTSKIGADFLHRVIDGHTGKLLFTDQIAHLMNRYEYAIDVARDVVSDAEYTGTDPNARTVNASTIRHLSDCIKELTPKTDAQLLKELLDATDALLIFARGKHGDGQIQAIEACKQAKAAYEASQP